MASGDSLPPAPAVWAQRSDVVYVTLNVADCQSQVMDLNEERLHFKGEGEAPKKTFENVLEFYGEVIPQESKIAVLPRNVPIMIKKKVEGFWPRLLKSKTKVHWLKTDFNKWRDEDDEEDEETAKQDFNLDQMMSQMGNFQGQGGPGGEDDADDDDADSDDEELPDLE